MFACGCRLHACRCVHILRTPINVPINLVIVPSSDPLSRLPVCLCGGQVVLAIKELLESRVKPMVQRDGGNIRYVGFEDGVVYLQLQGTDTGLSDPLFSPTHCSLAAAWKGPSQQRSKVAQTAHPIMPRLPGG